MVSHKSQGITRSINLSTSLHYSSLESFKNAGNGQPQLNGQSAKGLDNGYGLQGNPTCHELQDAVSDLEAGDCSLLYSSGLTALTALGGLLKSGDHWLLPNGVCYPLLRYAAYLQDCFGITYSTYDPLDLETLRANITPQTKLIHLETPCSVTFETTDIQETVAIAKEHDIITSADNTWASGILCKPLQLGVDISILSLTKYAAGYSDVFMGSVTTSDQRLFEQLAFHHRVYGYTVSPVSAMLVQRGLESLPIRLAAHGAHAQTLIEVIKQHPHVQQVYCADDITSSDISGSNGLFSIELKRRYDDAELEAPLRSLTTFAIGESWGGTRSMVLPFQPEELADRSKPPIGTILRFHAGLEDIELQVKDLVQLMRRL